MGVRYDDEGDAGRSREPVLLAEVLADTTAALRSRSVARPAAGATRCRECGARVQWCRTVHGRWMLMEADELPIWRVPAGRRWRVTGDGTAVGLRSADPTDTCRMSHFDVCPARPVQRAGGRPAR